MQTFWFVTIGVLWAGFFLLEGFDFGVGMLLPLVAKTDADRTTALRTIGPFWDGNEVWLVVAGGATFAAFPEWYASVFSGFYLAFALLLAGLIVRGVGIEYRGKAGTATGRRWCEAGVVAGSALAALLLGVAFADWLRGVLLDSAHDMTGGFFDLLSPYALLGGLVTLSLFAFHGANFLALRTDGVLADTATKLSRLLGPMAALLAVVFVLWTTQVRGGAARVVLAGVIVLALALAVSASRSGKRLAAFVATGLVAALLPAWTFVALWPDVLPARNDSHLSLTVHNASSSPYTLKVMTIVTLIFMPIVLVYQIWTYWVFRARVTGKVAESGGYGGDGAVGALVAKARESGRETLGLTPDIPTPRPPAGR